eukprot:2656031-Pleurochrysis_carterae.AAC.1
MRSPCAASESAIDTGTWRWSGRWSLWSCHRYRYTALALTVIEVAIEAIEVDAAATEVVEVAVVAAVRLAVDAEP